MYSINQYRKSNASFDTHDIALLCTFWLVTSLIIVRFWCSLHYWKALDLLFQNIRSICICRHSRHCIAVYSINQYRKSNASFDTHDIALLCTFWLVTSLIIVRFWCSLHHWKALDLLFQNIRSICICRHSRHCIAVYSINQYRKSNASFDTHDIALLCTFWLVTSLIIVRFWCSLHYWKALDLLFQNIRSICICRHSWHCIAVYSINQYRKSNASFDTHDIALLCTFWLVTSLIIVRFWCSLHHWKALDLLFQNIRSICIFRHSRHETNAIYV